MNNLKNINNRINLNIVRNNHNSLFHKTNGEYYLNLDGMNLLKLGLVLFFKLSILLLFFIVISYQLNSQTNLNNKTSNSYNSSFSGNRLQDIIKDNITTGFATPHTDLEIIILQNVPDFNFREENVSAQINDTNLMLKGISNIILEFLNSDSEIIKTYNVPINIKTFQNAYITNKTIKIGEYLTEDCLHLAKLETTSLSSDDYLNKNNYKNFIGNSVIKNIIKGNVILREYLDDNTGVKRGENVTLLVKNGIVTIRSNGVALTNGKIGEEVKVQRQNGISLSGTVIENKIILLK